MLTNFLFILSNFLFILSNISSFNVLAEPPEPLNLEDRSHRGENWKQFKRDWTYYEIVSKIDNEDDVVRVAHLLNVIGRDTQELFETFNLSADDLKDVTKVLKVFETRCVPVSNVIYERYMFNKRIQEAGESVEHFITDVIKLADHCQYGNLKDDLIRDKLVSGVNDDKVREKLLGIKNLTLAIAIETLRTTQAIKQRMKEMGSLATGENANLKDNVNAGRQKKNKDKGTREPPKPPRNKRPEGWD